MDVEQRAALKFCVKIDFPGLKLENTLQMPMGMPLQKKMQSTSDLNDLKKDKSLNDDKRSGIPMTLRSLSVALINELLDKDRWITLRVRTDCYYGKVINIFHKQLNI